MGDTIGVYNFSCRNLSDLGPAGNHPTGSTNRIHCPWPSQALRQSLPARGLQVQKCQEVGANIELAPSEDKFWGVLPQAEMPNFLVFYPCTISGEGQPTETTLGLHKAVRARRPGKPVFCPETFRRFQWLVTTWALGKRTNTFSNKANSHPDLVWRPWKHPSCLVIPFQAADLPRLYDVCCTTHRGSKRAEWIGILKISTPANRMEFLSYHPLLDAAPLAHHEIASKLQKI